MTIAFLSAKNTHKYFIYRSNFQNHWSINVSHLYCKYMFDGEKKSKSVSFVCILSNKYYVITYFSLSFWWHDNFCLTKQWHDTRMLTEMTWTFYTCNNFAIRFITAILKCRSKVVTRFLFHITSTDRNNFFKYLDKRVKTFFKIYMAAFCVFCTVDKISVGLIQVLFFYTCLQICFT